MAQGTQLMNLSDELLLEIAARVPDDTWSSLSRVNRRFNSIMATNTLPAKAAAVQFPIENSLLPPQRHSMVHLNNCKYWSEHILTLTASLNLKGDLQKLVTIATLVLYLKVDECKLYGSQSFKKWEARSQHAIWMFECREQFLNLNILRLLPLDIHLMLRYAMLKFWDRQSPLGDGLSFLFNHQQDPDGSGKWCYTAYDFLSYEANLLSPVYNPRECRFLNATGPTDQSSFWKSCYGHMVQEILSNMILPTLKTGRFLTFIEIVIEATRCLDKDPLKPLPAAPISSPRLEGVDTFPKIAQVEFAEQTKCAKEIMSQMEAPDGRFAREMLNRLDLAAVRSVITHHVDKVSKMTECELREGLYKEIQFLIE